MQTCNKTALRCELLLGLLAHLWFVTSSWTVGGPLAFSAVCEPIEEVARFCFTSDGHWKRSILYVGQKCCANVVRLSHRWWRRAVVTSRLSPRVPLWSPPASRWRALASKRWLRCSVCCAFSFCPHHAATAAHSQVDFQAGITSYAQLFQERPDGRI